jgi:hypothetical protein
MLYPVILIRPSWFEEAGDFDVVQEKFAVVTGGRSFSEQIFAILRKRSRS